MTPDQPIPSTAELWNLIQEQRAKMEEQQSQHQAQLQEQRTQSRQQQAKIEALEAQVKQQRPIHRARGRSSALLTSLLLVVLLIAAPALARSTLADSSEISSAVSTQQYTLTGSDGAAWVTMDATNLSLSLTPSVDSTVVLSGNSDLWTSSAGYNQDLGIAVSGGTYSGIVAWKESGGFAGTYSPNAALVHSVIPVSAGVTYTITLQWKANKADPGTIWAGAGPIGGAFSPTRLTAQLQPSAAQAGAILQYNGSNWVPIMTFCPNCNMNSADLHGQDLNGAYFPAVNLSYANLVGTSLSVANLTYANLYAASLQNAYITYANLNSANLDHADLYSAHFDGVDLSGAYLTNAYLQNATGGMTANVTGVTWSNTICPDNTNSDSDGYTCVGHGF